VAVEVIPSKTANAFAVPGNRIVILGGLFDLAGSGDALAGVLAHEMGHVALDHPTIGLVRTEAIGVAKLVFLGEAGRAGDLGGLMVQFAYTRDMEEEADRQAIAILQAAGLRTAGLADFFAIIEKEKGADTPLAALLGTHPPTAARRALAASLSGEGGESMDAATFEAIRGICGAK
jgi:predicted Zn-dependent protease